MAGRFEVGRRPWFREVSSIVAVLALLFSFGTTAVALDRAARQDENEREAQLTSLVAELSSLSRDLSSAAATYASSPQTLTAVDTQIYQQQLVIAEQAASVMQVIPNDVSSAEYWFVANVLLANGVDEVGLPLLQRAIDRAGNANDAVVALRAEASHDFATGRADDGRGAYATAMHVFERFPNSSQYYVAYTTLWTVIDWTTAELGIRACDRARTQYEAGRALAPEISPTSDEGREYANLGVEVASCTPSPAPPASPNVSPGIAPSAAG
jgi:hypothetical protein